MKIQNVGWMLISVTEMEEVRYKYSMCLFDLLMMNAFTFFGSSKRQAHLLLI